MKISINKTKLTATTITILLMTSAFILMANPIQAQDDDLYNGTPHTTTRPGVSGSPPPTDATITWTFDAKPRLSFSPQPVGVNQIFTVNLWLHHHQVQCAL